MDMDSLEENNCSICGYELDPNWYVCPICKTSTGKLTQ